MGTKHKPLLFMHVCILSFKQIKIWEDLKSTPIAVLRPHDGQPVNSVTFFRPPDNPKHIVLITGVCMEFSLKLLLFLSTLKY